MNDYTDLIARLRTFVREHLHGGCRLLSMGDECPCALCALDMLNAALESQAAEIARLAELARVALVERDIHLRWRQDMADKLQRAEAERDVLREVAK